MNKKPCIPVVVINYRTSELIQGVIDSIKEDTIDTPVIILDNGSTTETFAELKEISDDRITIIRSEANLGFSGGVNFALDYISGHFTDVKYFFLLNPDALCSPNVIGGLLHIIKDRKNAACISPQVINENGKPGYAGGQINFRHGKVKTSVYAGEKNSRSFYEVDVFTGCAVLLDFAKTKEAGMFNEELFMYFDEADISIKFRQLGYSVLYTPLHTVYHNHSYTTRKTSFVKTYYMSRNRFKVFHSTMPLYNKAYFLVHEFAYHLKYRRLKNALYHLKGVYHYLTGKMGNGFTTR